MHPKTLLSAIYAAYITVDKSFYTDLVRMRNLNFGNYLKLKPVEHILNTFLNP